MTMTANQVVAYNVAKARAIRGWTQEEAAEALAPCLGTKWSVASFSAIECSVDGGDEWDRLAAQGIDPWDLNVEFLETIAARGDRVLLSVPKADIPATGYLRDEVNYLVNKLDYVWVNQWSLRPRG